MKKILLTAAAACIALAACTKNEVKSVVPDREITFQTISTKAAEAYGNDNKFKTWAYLHTASYAAGVTNQLYLGGADGLLISHQSDGTWKNSSQSYYWPKDESSKLTFFSYGLGDGTCALTTGTVACSFDEGVTVSGYDIVSNHDVDFMVADVAKDQTKNIYTYFTDGVPTLFRHKLSYVIFKIKTGDIYADKTFKLKSIKLMQVAKTGNYTQGATSTEGWMPLTSTDISFFTGDLTLSATEATPAASQSYYLPQTFKTGSTILNPDTKVVVEYTIETDNGTLTPATETVTVEKHISELFGDAWKMETKYTCTITLSLDEILWDPAVEPWTPSGSHTITL
ncbi:MAG: hypothetical protein ACI395_02925 [Candidatus Cryptobacteroides sp.]